MQIGLGGEQSVQSSGVRTSISETEGKKFWQLKVKNYEWTPLI
jgi:hypothetical protein